MRDDLIAVAGGGKIKPIGYLVWFSVPDQQVSLRSLKKHWMVSGLDPTPLPTDTRAVDTFKRAMRAQDGRHRDETTRQIRDNKVDLVLETRDDVVYQISTTVRDLEEQVIDYPKAMRVTFNKHTERIGFKPLGGVERGEVVALMSAIEDYYEQHAKHITGAKVRTLVRNYLRDEPDEQSSRVGLSGENLRGKAGGIYFVMAKHKDQLDALADMLDELYRGGAYLHSVPMADTASEREIIRRHHAANTREDLKEMIATTKGLLSAERDRAPRSDSVAFQWTQFHRMQRKVAAYKELLGDEIEEIDQMAGIWKKQLDKLI